MKIQLSIGRKPNVNNIHPYNPTKPFISVCTVGDLRWKTHQVYDTNVGERSSIYIENNLNLDSITRNNIHINHYGNITDGVNLEKDVRLEYKINT